jgi:streptomycin 6-kinase
MINLPSEFINKVISVHGDKGRVWFDNLDKLIIYCKHKWQFELTEIKNLSFNFVAEVQLKDSSKAILKLGLPGKEFQSELATLAAYNGQGFCKLLDAEPEKGIMLLECIEPGKHLSSIQNDLAAATAVADLIKNMNELDPKASFSFQTAGDQYNHLVNLHKRFGNTNIPECLFNSAESAWQSIQANLQQQRLLHGDLHQENILSAPNGEWKAIDPKGIISETGYELVPFLINDLKYKDIQSTISKRIDIFSDQLDIDRDRIIQWGIFRSVLSVYWQLEDNLPIATKDLAVCEVFYSLMH